MSNEVYGYLEFTSIVDRSNLALLLENETGIGFSSIPVSELYNFPQNLLPRDETFVWCFLIGDKPGKRNATYLIDNLDYAPEADIGLPHLGEKRFEILVNSIITMIEVTKPKRIVVALTDSSQIEETKSVQLSELLATVVSDCKDICPPDCVYDVTIGEARSQVVKLG